MLQLTVFYLILQLTCIYVSLCVYLFAFFWFVPADFLIHVDLCLKHLSALV